MTEIIKLIKLNCEGMIFARRGRTGRRAKPCFDLLEGKLLLSLTRFDFDDLSPGTKPREYGDYADRGANFYSSATVATEILSPENPYNSQVFPAHSGNQVAFDTNVSGQIGVTGFYGDSWSTTGGYVSPSRFNPVTMSAYTYEGKLLGSVTTSQGADPAAYPEHNQLLQITAKDIWSVVFKSEYKFGGLATKTFSLDDFFFDDDSASPLPDISVSGPSLSGSTINFRYAATGNPGPFTVALYYSSTPTYTPGSAVPVIDPATNKQAVQIISPDGAGTQGNGVFNFSQPPVAIVDLPYILVVSDPGNKVLETNETNNSAYVTLPNIAVALPSFNEANRGLDYSYAISGTALSLATKVDLLWASGTTVDSIVGAPIVSTPSETAVGTYKIHVDASFLTTPPMDARYLLVVADPPDDQLPRGRIIEISKADNIAALERPPAVVNVVTHGFNPNPLDWEGFVQQYKDLGGELDDLPPAGSPLKGLVRSYVPQWDSASGWDQAFVSVLSSLFLAGPAKVAALLYAELSMRHAAMLAEQAAQTIHDFITDPKNDFLIAPEYGQIIDLVGHSRGGAVNALLSRLLTDDGYFVSQYVALDGFSTDWPFPASILGDISITETAIADRKVNYRVEQGLGQVVGDLMPDFLIENFSPAQMAQLLLETTNWRAPARQAAQFEDINIYGIYSKTGKLTFSNHVNVTELYARSDPTHQKDVSEQFVLSDYQYILDAYENQRRSSSVSSASTAHASPSIRGLPDGLSGTNPLAPSVGTSSGSPDHGNFDDGAFTTLGSLWGQVIGANIRTDENELLRYWVGLVEDPARVLASMWTATGDAKLVLEGGNALAELALSSGPASIGQYLEFGSQVSSIGFDLAVLTAHPGDQLQVLFDDQVLVTLDLTQTSVDHRVSVPVSGYASRKGEITFQLLGDDGGSARIRLDNLGVYEANKPLAIGPVSVQAAIAGELVTIPVTANSVVPGRALIYSFEAEPPAGATIDRLSGIVTWDVPATTAPGDYVMTVRATDDVNPPNSVLKSFVMTVSSLQGPTNISGVSGLGTFGGTSTFGAMLTSGGSPLAGKSIEFSLDAANPIVLGRAVTDSDGFAMLTGANTATYDAGTYSLTARFSGDSTDAVGIAGGELVIKPALAQIALSGLDYAYDGVPHAVIARTTPPSLNGVMITYRRDSLIVPEPIQAGTYEVRVSVANPNFLPASTTDTLIIRQASPVLAWDTPAEIVFGVALSPSQLNAKSSVPGVFTYTPAEGTVLPPGGRLVLSAIFTPTESANYAISAITTMITILDAPPIPTSPPASTLPRTPPRSTEPVLAPPSNPISPYVKGVSNVGRSRKGLISIAIVFSEAMDADSVTNPSLYSLLGGVRRKKQLIFGKRLQIKEVRYDGDAKICTITLSKPYNGAVKLVLAGAILTAENSPTRFDFTTSVK